MKKIILIMCFMFPVFLYSQTITRYALTSAGGFENNNYTIDYSVGQVILPYQADNQIVTHGFIQPTAYKDNIKPEVNKTEINTICTIYPNPAITFTNLILTSKTEIKNLEIIIYDISGKAYYPNYATTTNSHYKKIKLNVSTLVSGTYLIKLTINNLIIKTDFLIIK